MICGGIAGLAEEKKKDQERKKNQQQNFAANRYRQGMRGNGGAGQTNAQGEKLCDYCLKPKHLWNVCRKRIANEKAFAMVPWRPDLERQRGRSLVIEARERGISWTLPGGRQRGIGR